MEPSSAFSLANYKQTIFNLSSWLRQLRGYGETLDLPNVVTALDEMLQRVETNAFAIAIVGEFKRGKSTLINALLGREILPSDILPTTATLNRITYGIRGQVRILFKDGSTEDIGLDQLPQYVTKLTPEAEAIAATVQEAVVYYPIPYCQNNVDIIDTPGLSDEAAMTETTLAVLPQVDAAIFVVMAQAPFSESERAFLENNLLTESLGRILFVVTGIDRCQRPEDVDRVIQSVQDRIKTHVLKGAEDRFGAESAEYHDYLSRIGHPRVFGVSAYQALQAKAQGDADLLAESRFPALEVALEKFLTEERGVIFLQVPVNRILTTARELLKAIDAKQTALLATRTSLRTQYEQAVARLTAAQQQRQTAQRQQETAIATLQQRFSQLLTQISGDLQATANQVLETTLLTPYDFNQAIVAERMVTLERTVADTLETQSRRWAGKLQVELKRGISELPADQQPSPEQTNQLLNAIGLHCVNLGAVLKKQIQQSQLAWRLATDTTGGVGGWFTQTLRSQELVPTFKTTYQSQLVAVIQQQIASTALPQTLNTQLGVLLEKLKVTDAAQPDPLQAALTDHRLQLEREETRLEFQFNDLHTLQQGTQQILEQAQTLAAQLLALIPE
jgi:small GTP-binding protein